ncbi:MAG TPA: alginate export family protein [Gammaproteobacteria bacterium]|nr:alginate export family protein [Gammaproteobacteria bacterium]
MNRRAHPIVAGILAGAALCAPRAQADMDFLEGRVDGSKLVLSADVVGGWYQSNDSWFGASETFLGANTDHWAEIGLAPALTFETKTRGGGAIFAALSGVYTSTAGNDASGLTIGLTDTSAFTLEQGYVGWAAEDLFDRLEGDTLTITGGRLDYSIGSGLLMDDGGADGGDRGGWYLGLRKAFSESLVASLDSDTWLLEAFNVKNQPRAGGTQGQAYGANAERKLGEDAAVGGTYMQVDSNVAGEAKLDVLSLRANWRAANGLGLAGEYADESSSQIAATGYFAEVSYARDDRPWLPEFSYRYAHFDGDDLGTPKDERFREIAYGFTDWGSWYQGEITGEYALGNGNLDSQRLRAQFTPLDGVTFNAMYYRFTLDQPARLSSSSRHWGDEYNFTLDWQVNDNVYLVAVLGLLSPGDAAKRITGGSDDWLHTMLNITYSW